MLKKKKDEVIIVSRFFSVYVKRKERRGRTKGKRRYRTEGGKGEARRQIKQTELRFLSEFDGDEIINCPEMEVAFRFLLSPV